MCWQSLSFHLLDGRMIWTVSFELWLLWLDVHRAWLFMTVSWLTSRLELALWSTLSWLQSWNLRAVLYFKAASHNYLTCELVFVLKHSQISIFVSNTWSYIYSLNVTVSFSDIDDVILSGVDVKKARCILTKHVFGAGIVRQEHILIALCSYLAEVHLSNRWVLVHHGRVSNWSSTLLLFWRFLFVSAA